MARTREKRIKKQEDKRKSLRRKKIMLLLLIVIIVASIIIIYFTKIHEGSYMSYKVLTSKEYTDDMGTGSLSYGNKLVLYNRNGVAAYNKEASPIWKSSFEMVDPIGDVCGDYLVIADRGNNLVQIFNQKGLEGEIIITRDIVKVQVARQGVVAVLSEDKDSNYINIYNKEGTELVDARVTNVSKEGYPIDIALSDDGKKLVVSYITVNQGRLISHLAFYNFGGVGQNEPGRLVAGVPYEDIVIPRVVFLNNDYVCVYKEDSVMLFIMEEIPELVAEDTFEEKIISVLYDEKHFGLVLESSDTLHKRLLLYNLNGEKVLDKEIDFAYDKVFLFGEEIIFHDNLSVLILKINGSEKFSYKFSTNISALYPINRLDRYYLVGTEKIDSIQLLQ